VLLAVNGTLMRGLELNGNLLGCGGTFVREAMTAPVYRLYSIGDIHPAMLRVDSGGTAIALEIWELPPAGFAQVLPASRPGFASARCAGDAAECWACWASRGSARGTEITLSAAGAYTRRRERHKEIQIPLSRSRFALCAR
jgi:hypothetical protein